jgi:primosomal protein N' (replication factor Y)
LNGRRVDAWVVDHPSVDGAAYELKQILDVLSVGPSAEVVGLAQWCSHRFAGPLRAVLTIASPPKRVKNLVAAANVARPGRVERQSIAGIDELMTVGGGVVVWPPSRPVRGVLESALKRGRTLVVCPGVATARTIATALRREGFSVALMPDDWQRAAEGVDVVVGARSAVWAPCPDMTAIVVIDEHDERLQDERSPTWHARDVAIERARRVGVPCLFVSALPTVSATHWAGASRVLVPHDQPGDWPRIILCDPFTSVSSTDDNDAPRGGSLSSELVAPLRDASRVVACVLNVKGRARLVACRSCRDIARCEKCEAAMVLGDVLDCPACGHQRPVVCGRCGATAMALIRKGVSRLREELEAAAGRPVREITAGSESHGGAAAGVYVGTEAVLHRLDSADVVAFLDFDNEVFAPTYRAGEHAWTLLVHAARLLRGAKDPLIILQSNDATNPALARFAAPDPTAVIETETNARRMLGLPPFVSLARVDAGDASRALLGAPPLGIDVAANGEAGWLVRGADPVAFADFCAELRRGQARVYVDPQRY